MADKKMAALYIAAGASLWGIIGIFVTFLYELGFTPTQVVTIRVLSASFFLLFYIIFKNRHLLKIQLSDSKYFIGTGIFSIVLFNWCLFSAMEETSISIAAILLYTAPAFVTIFSRILFKEALTTRKVLALIITFAGCSFVIGILPNSKESVSLYGLILGLGSGLFYALYSIFGKFALRKYDTLTVTVYTFIFAAFAITPLSGLWVNLHLFSTIEVWLCIIGLGFFSTMLAFILYTKGLQSLESSRASIIATIEPVVAALLSFFIFHEKLNLWQYLGITLVIAAVFIVQESTRKSGNKTFISNESSF
ncbi:drug/metabolite transporter (DMT)-like permease [Bacillus pakistanensis]|uniref:Drug/metabolite transporter (DMT)-like permease n=1 Tax=Rossellomorea pakistanensis TaxID=992288 RepID=A0ABS2NB55_9BACI|nr:DMT family transporter [Bacillus pakistanensis]MBM7585055.1 drug/metabolite transporter (DMT)-like permease [Bacillus pakistanensis]